MTKPLIGDDFWFEYSKKLVEAGSKAPGEISDKFQKMVVWLWGIYTAGAAVGFSLADKQLSLLSTLLIASASASLILVYWCAVWIQVPVDVSFDPRSPTQIKDAYAMGTKTKRRRTKITMWVSFLAAILVVLSLTLASLSPSAATQAPGMVAVLGKKDVKQQLSLTAINLAVKPEDPLVTVRVQASPQKEADGSPWNFKPTAKGLLQVSLPVNPPVEKATVILNWQGEKGVDYQLRQEVAAAQ